MEYQTYVDTLVAAGIIKDASYIWWAVRPSLSLPTLELRIADACTHLEDALCIAAIYRCLVRHLVNHPNLNADLDVVDRAFAEENKWRAQRYGTAASFIDRSAATATPIETAVGSLLELLAEDAQALDCVKEFWHAVEILKRGSSADEQLRMYAIARSEGHSHITALKSVVDWLYHTTIEFDTEPISAGPRSVESWERRIY